MFKKNKLSISSIEMKYESYLLTVFCAIMTVLILFSLAIIEGKINTITEILSVNKLLI
jgi:hypothetical protein